MFSRNIKRSMILTLVLTMMLSVLPILASAADSTQGSAVSEIQTQIDIILMRHGITAEMTDEEIANAIATADSDTIRLTMDEMAAIESRAQTLSESEIAELDTDLYGRFCNVMDRLYSAVPIATTVNVLDGQVSVTDSLGNGALSNGTVTIQAKGSLFSKATNTVTITNETTNTASLSFNYTASKYNSFTIAGAAGSSSGTYSNVLDPGASVTLVLVSNSGFSNTNATLTLSNFSLTVAAASSNVTFNYDSTFGNITVAGSTVASGTTQEISLDDGVALVATAKSGSTFLGWIDATDGRIISTAASYTLTPANDMTVRAAFSGGASADAWFRIGQDYLFDDLNAADNFAKTANNKTIVLVANGTLPAGDYEISSGVTLLIPYNDAHTLCKDTPTVVETYTTPSAYRTLTMASGAHITVLGDMSVSGSQSAQYLKNGLTSGPLGFVKMEAESSIVVGDGTTAGNLYAWGYIMGSGTVTINSGSTVYECFQVTDFRGGDATSQMTAAGSDHVTKYKVFPMSQYYVQNVEVPMTLMAGAAEYGHFAVNVAIAGIQKAPVPFIGADGMFNISKGASITKDYDESTDRMVVDVDTNGEATVSSFTFDIKVQLLGEITIDSSNYVLPITNNITINIESGSTLNLTQDVALLPGAEINIEEGSTGKLANEASLFVYDVDEWGKYCAEDQMAAFIPLPYAPGKQSDVERVLKDAEIRIDGTADASEGYVYTTSSGANIYSTGTGIATIRPGSQTVTYQVENQVAENGSEKIYYKDIAITSAWLKNADGAYVASADYPKGTYTYTDGVWKFVCGTHTEVTDAAVDATCTTAGKTEGKHCSVCNTVLVRQEVIPALGHDWNGTSCNTCGATTIISQKGRNLSYEDVIYVLDIFELNGVDGIDLTVNAGLLVWPVNEFPKTIEFDEKYAVIGLQPYKNTGYYYGQSEGIYTRDLHEEAYYVGYVKLADGSYIFSEAKLYSPSIYAYNMLSKDTADAETKALCEALLNYISAAQMYFDSETAEADLVNADLSDTQKALNWTGITLNLAGEVPADKQVTRDESIFTEIGKNLLFEAEISLGALYKIEDPYITASNPEKCGTIFWTASQFAELEGTPSIDNYGSGIKVGMTQYRDYSGQWVSNAPMIAPKDMADTQYYFLGYVIQENEDGSTMVSYSGVQSYTIEQYINNKVEESDSETMKAFAQRLYFYERAAREALLSE